MKLSSANSFSLEEYKICHLGKGYMPVKDILCTHLYGLFHHVVNDEKAEDEFTRHDEIVHYGDISYQLHCSHGCMGDGSTRRGKLYCQTA